MSKPADIAWAEARREVADLTGEHRDPITVNGLTWNQEMVARRIKAWHEAQALKRTMLYLCVLIAFMMVCAVGLELRIGGQ